MVNEAQLLHRLQQVFPAANYCYQLVIQDNLVAIYLNYPEAPGPQPAELVNPIQTAIAPLSWGEIEQVYLLGRQLGNTDPDWEVPLEIRPAPASPQPPITAEPSSAALGSEVDSVLPDAAPSETMEEIERSPWQAYCFTRNQKLLTSELVLPSEDIGQLVYQFHLLSVEDKQLILPLLDEFFRGKGNLDNLDLEDPDWVNSLVGLPLNQQRKASIWLSRYCINPTATLTELAPLLSTAQTIPSANAAPSAPQPTSAHPEPVDPLAEFLSTPAAGASRSPSPVTADLVTPYQPHPDSEQSPVKPQRKGAVKRQPKLWQWLIPIIWATCTLLFVIHDARAMHDPRQYASLCKGSASSAEICQLAGQLVGADQFKTQIAMGKALTEKSLAENDVAADALPDGEPLPPGTLSGDTGLADCAKEASLGAGYTLKDLINEEAPIVEPLSGKVHPIFPGLALADVVYPQKETKTPVRTACTIFGDATEAEVMASDVIPTQWPTIPYKKKTTAIRLRQTTDAVSILSNLGVNTLFTAVGIFLAAYFGLAIRIDSLNTLYLSAFLLGFVELFLSFIPRFGIFSVVSDIAFLSLSLGITSAFVKGLEIDWSAGYFFVSLGTLTVIATRKFCGFLLFYSFFSLFG
jgi:hypothetical protein